MVIVHILRDIIAFSLWAFGLVLFALLAAVTQLGFLMGAWRARHKPSGEEDSAGISTLTSGMLGLMAFLLALSIGFGQNRFEARRQTTVAEANTIGTAWLRAGLAQTAAPSLADLIKTYAGTRLAYLEARAPKAEAALLARTSTQQNEIWQQTLAAAKTMPGPLAGVLINAVNDMIDASLEQRYALESRVPVETSSMLLVAALLTVGALGYQMGLGGQRHFVLTLLLLLMLSSGMGLIVDLSQPRHGFTRVDTEPLIWTIQGFGSGGGTSAK